MTSRMRFVCSLLKHTCFIFLTIGITACGIQPEPPTATPETISTSAGSEFSADGKLNLNNMTLIALRANIQGINDRMAFEFFEYQPYKSIETFRTEMVEWTDEATVKKYEKQIFVPIDVDTADVATLMQIPNITIDIAKLMKAMQPYKSNEDFLSILGESLPEQHMTTAATYLCADKPKK